MTNADEERFIKLLTVVTNLNKAFGSMCNALETLNERVNDLEVKLDNLRAQYLHHDHPYKPEPRYGGNL